MTRQTAKKRSALHTLRLLFCLAVLLAGIGMIVWGVSFSRDKNTNFTNARFVMLR